MTDLYHLERQKRKTVSVRVNPDGALLVKAPMGMSKIKIDNFLEQSQQAIQHLKAKISQKTFLNEKILQEDFKKFHAIQKLQTYFDNIAPSAAGLGLITDKPPKFKILKSRWGSCHSNRQITLNIFLGLLPDNLIKMVIAHEFCHLKEMNHSAKFYALLKKLHPTYQHDDRLLRQYVIER